MHLLRLTLDEPAADIALDEALLEAAEAGDGPADVLRLWEPATHFVVVGRGSRAHREVNLAVCRRDEIPVLRRASGGAAVVAGPGCLMYSLVLEMGDEPRLADINVAHDVVLGRIAAGLAPLVPGIERSGTSDLTLPPCEPGGARVKCSGNSLRCRRRTVLYHGTLLYDFDLACIGRWLTQPPRQPEYRAQRPHDEFVVNLPLRRLQLEAALVAAWQAQEPLKDWPRRRVNELVSQRYADPDWQMLAGS